MCLRNDPASPLLKGASMSSVEKVILRDSTGHYTVDGERLPSVTTILATRRNYGLDLWRVKCVVEGIRDELKQRGWKITEAQWDDVMKIGKQGPSRKSTEATDFGSAFHDMVEHYCHNGTPLPGTQQLDACFKVWLKWVADNNFVPMMIERTVYSKLHKYAGTLDSIGEVCGPATGGKKMIVCIDWKTTDSAQHRIYPDMALQLSAYGVAVNEMKMNNRLTAPEIDGAMIVSVHRSQKKIKDKLWTNNELDDHFNGFHHALGMFHYTKRSTKKK